MNYTAQIYFDKRTEGLIYDGLRFTGTDAVGKLCRHINEEGILTIYGDNGKVSMTGINILKRAKKALTEGDKTGLRKIDYVPRPLDTNSFLYGER